tara:strand:- start:36 stop:677 length:642 start_codon:yes stop_codon:yes gene_type:complete
MAPQYGLSNEQFTKILENSHRGQLRRARAKAELFASKGLEVPEKGLGYTNKPIINKEDTQQETNKKKSGGGFGLKRMIGGAADQLTGNLFDFDKRSGGGLIRKTAGALGGLFGGGENKPVSADKVMAKEPKIKQIKIPAEGLDSLLIKIASKQDIKTPVGQPSLSGPKITVMQENKSINTPMNEGGADGGKAIPNFNVGYGSARKMKQLGISR